MRSGLLPPGAPRYAALLGTNTSFRRGALLAIGGFDEEFAYFLDETEVCLRIIDNGGVVKYADGAFVHHKFASSHLRRRQVLVTRYDVVKSQAYFAFRHGAPAHGALAAMRSVLDFVGRHRDEVAWCVGEGLLPPEAAAAFEEEAQRAVADGVARALAGPPRRLSPATLAAHRAPYKPFATLRLTGRRRTVCLFTRQYPPGPVDGIGRFVHELARGIAELGHTVHVLTAGEEDRVDLEDGVWVHRLRITAHPAPLPDIPAAIWDYSATLMREVERIARHDRVDLIQAPAWDSEGAAALFQRDIPLVTSLHTPMLVAASMHPHWMIDAERMESAVLPTMRWERRAILFADALYANGVAIVETIEREYDLALDRARIGVVPHGLADRAPPRPPAPAPGRVRLLFVGRLEWRKGIDLLLRALCELLPEFPELEADIVGEEVEGGGFAQAFRAAAAGAPWAARARFHGRLGPAQVDAALAACDVFVAPSRFESFGLVYVEAMMHGKPVVAAASGGVGEVVGDGESGLLFPPGERAGLVAALRRLIASAQLRARLGAGGRACYLAGFTRRVMAERSLAFYESVLARRAREAAPGRPAPAGAPALTRLCTLSEFRPDSPLQPLLREFGDGIVDRRPWACALAVEGLRRARPERRPDGAAPDGLVIAASPLPDLAAAVPEWRIETAIAAPERAPGEALAALLAERGRAARDYDHLACLVVLDPLAEEFAATAAALARLCRGRALLQLFLAVPGGAPAGAAAREPIAAALARAGLRAPARLDAILAGAAGAAGFADESREPYLGVRFGGEDRAVAALAVERAAARAAAAPEPAAAGAR